MSQSADIKRRLSRVVEEQQALLATFNATLLNGDQADHSALQTKLQRLAAEMQRLSADLRFAQTEGASITKVRGRSAGKTVREQVLDILDEVGVPLAPSTVSEFALATTGADVAASRFASLRRDEERSARRDPTARPAWVAPALGTARLTAIPRLLTSSAWNPEQRLVGARSLRVNHLRTTLAFLGRYERLRAAAAPQAEQVEGLVLRYARGVPGAVISGESTNPDRMRKVIDAELAAIVADDQGERREAAARLSRYGEQQRIWGLPAVIEGGPQSGRLGG
jgi:hypothetical protein